MARRKEAAPPRPCEYCGQDFRPWKVDGRFCSSRCIQAFSRDRGRTPTKAPMPDSHDLAWAAGFTDGEGCFDATSKVSYETTEGRRERRYLRLSVTQKDPLLLVRLGVIFGVGNIYLDKARPGKGESHKWVVNGRQAFHVANLLWPWLGEPKKRDFKRAIRLVYRTRSNFVRQPQRGCSIVIDNGGQ